jgi:hypothetical protein
VSAVWIVARSRQACACSALRPSSSTSSARDGVGADLVELVDPLQDAEVVLDAQAAVEALGELAGC